MTEPRPVVPLPDDVPQQLAAATQAWTKLRRAAAYASFDAWTLAIFGVLSMLCCGGYGSLQGLFISIALMVTAFVEFRCVRGLRRLDPAALPHLAYNQLALAGAIVIYSCWSLISIAHGGEPLDTFRELLAAAGQSASDPQVQSLTTLLLNLMYGILIVVTIAMQGGTALFYLSRRKNLKWYLEQTPPWVQQMQRERGTVSVG